VFEFQRGWPILLRIGAVTYLNARPLTTAGAYGHRRRIVFDHPAAGDAWPTGSRRRLILHRYFRIGVRDRLDACMLRWAVAA